MNLEAREVGLPLGHLQRTATLLLLRLLLPALEGTSTEGAAVPP